MRFAFAESGGGDAAGGKVAAGAARNATNAAGGCGCTDVDWTPGAASGTGVEAAAAKCAWGLGAGCLPLRADSEGLLA